ncbi:hypothetical protein [Sphingomonas aracearum]|uniref:hypothetical protein n=1 Tax=Sphingomonas aracearum TaxID=2283317 RepID=UPI0015F11D67|nr:hypothetical protein [Sphingomonas aracearum]
MIRTKARISSADPSHIGDDFREEADCRGRHSKADTTYLKRTSAFLVIGACLYNALLAILSARGLPVTLTHVALCEILILGIATLLLATSKARPLDAAALSLLVAFFLGALLLSFVNSGFVVEAFRNVSIIAVFSLLGLRCDAHVVRWTFGIIIGVVLAVMILEMAALPVYTSVFNPFAYYQSTRGLGEVDYDDLGVFGNARGFEGRFTFGLFTTPRTSSIFLEQTSLANFCSVVGIYLLAMWRSLGRGERLLGLAFVLLALVSNNTRMGSVFALLCLVGYHLFPRLPRAALMLLPLVILGLAGFLTTQMEASREDDLAGRIGLSVKLLGSTDLAGTLGARAFETGQFPDSGYSYVLYSSSIVGAVALWLYVTLFIPFDTPAQRRCAWGLALFFFLNLLIAGNAIFAMKIAAPLWLLAGHVAGLSGSRAGRPRAFSRAAAAIPRRAALASTSSSRSTPHAL